MAGTDDDEPDQGHAEGGAGGFRRPCHPRIAPAQDHAGDHGKQQSQKRGGDVLARDAQVERRRIDLQEQRDQEQAEQRRRVVGPEHAPLALERRFDGSQRGLDIAEPVFGNGQVVFGRRQRCLVAKPPAKFDHLQQRLARLLDAPGLVGPDRPVVEHIGAQRRIAGIEAQKVRAERLGGLRHLCCTPAPGMGDQGFGARAQGGRGVARLGSQVGGALVQARGTRELVQGVPGGRQGGGNARLERRRCVGVDGELRPTALEDLRHRDVAALSHLGAGGLDQSGQKAQRLLGPDGGPACAIRFQHDTPDQAAGDDGGQRVGANRKAMTRNETQQTIAAPRGERLHGFAVQPALQVRGERTGAGVALGRLYCRGPGDDCRRFPGQRCLFAARTQHGFDQLAEAVDVAEGRYRATLDLLGARVIRCVVPHLRIAAGRVGGLEQLGNAEVEQPGGALGGHQQVGRLDVAVNDQSLVREMHRVGDLNQKPRAAMLRNPVHGAPAVDRFTIDEIDRQPGLAVPGAAAVDQTSDVRMIQIGQDLALDAQALQPIAVGEAADQLDCHALAILVVVAFGREYRAHAAVADFAAYTPGPEALANRPGRPFEPARAGADQLGNRVPFIGIGAQQRDQSVRQLAIIATGASRPGFAPLRGLRQRLVEQADQPLIPIPVRHRDDP
jgi:hypothetical protein